MLSIISIVWYHDICTSSLSLIFIFLAMANLSGRTELLGNYLKKARIKHYQGFKDRESRPREPSARLIVTGMAFSSQQTGLAYRRRLYVNWKDQ